MVRSGSVVADIGTDHAYLPAKLVLDGICPTALACDLRKGPLENAKKTVELYSVADKIELRLSDGFDKIQPHEADDFVICGMGGTLMTELVARTPWLKDKAKRLVLQPQSHAEDIRKYLTENGFRILFEDACTDSGKLYCAMTAEYTGETTEKDISYIYTGELVKSKKPEAKEFLTKIKERLEIKANAERTHGSEEKAAELEAITAEMEKKIDEMQCNG